MNFDIVVVGGNLAGTTAAISALEKGARVALIEKNIHPYNPPHCGEGLDVNSISFINLKKIKCPINPINKISINLTETYEYLFKTNERGLVVFDRNFLEKSLLEKTIHDGGDVFLGTKMKQFLPPDTINTSTGKILKAKILIDASGIHCVIGKKIGLKTTLNPWDIGVCIQKRVKGEFDARTIKIWFHTPYAPNGYGWIFPINDTLANIGLGIPGGQHVNLNQLLNDYIKNELDFNYEILSTFRSCVPMSIPLQTIYKDNVMITGDAARLVNPFLGSGISNAICSGCLAGCVGSEYLENNIDSLSLYQHLLEDKIKRLTKSYKKREKIYRANRVVPVYHKAMIAFSFANRIIPDYFNRNVKKVVKKDIALIRHYKKTPTLF